MEVIFTPGVCVYMCACIFAHVRASLRMCVRAVLARRLYSILILNLNLVPFTDQSLPKSVYPLQVLASITVLSNVGLLVVSKILTCSWQYITIFHLLLFELPELPYHIPIQYGEQRYTGHVI